MNKDTLTLKELAPYYPYEVKYRNHNGKTSTLGAIVESGLVCKRHNVITKPSEAKLYLRPLSQLTQEIEHNGHKFIPLESLKLRSTYEPIDDFLDHALDFNFKPNEASWDCCPLWVFLNLLEWHFDVFNLIPRNLALEIKE